MINQINILIIKYSIFHENSKKKWLETQLINSYYLQREFSFS
jgi:hypothetical protein